VVAPREIVADHLCDTVTENHAAIIPEHSITDGGLYANARCTPSYDQISDRVPLERGVQLSVVEPAVSAFVEGDVGGVGL
jgi:hypothetical protein